MNERFRLVLSFLVAALLFCACDPTTEEASDVITLSTVGDTTLADGLSVRSIEVTVDQSGESVREVQLFANGGQLLDARTGTPQENARALLISARVRQDEQGAEDESELLYVDVLLKSQRDLGQIEVVAELPKNPEFSAHLTVPFKPVRFLGHVVRDIQDEDGSSYTVLGADGQPALMLAPASDTTGVPLVFVLNTERARPGGTLHLETTAGTFASSDSVAVAVPIPQSGVLTVRLKNAEASPRTSVPRTLYAEIGGFRGTFPIQFR